MTISRRKFLGITGGVAAAAAAGAVSTRSWWSSELAGHVERARSGTGSNNGRVLVVVHLGGGNDGLNTLVPTGDGRYHDQRPSLGVPDGDLVTLAGLGGYGLHKALAPLQKWWDGGHLAAINGIGLPGQSRSHFRASDAWWTAQPTAPNGYGWLGRWREATGDSNPLRAVALGLPTLALSAKTALSTSIADPTAFSVMTPHGVNAADMTKAFLATAHPLASEPTLAASQQAIPDAFHAVDVFTPALSGRDVVHFTEPAGTPSGATEADQVVSVTNLLEVAAGIIELNVGTQVIVASVSGFDTHGDQAAHQPQLLSDLAQGLDGFLSTMQHKGRLDDVLVITTSEFGRRVEENGSGTDHGEANVQFLAGGRVNGKRLVGTADLAHLDDGDLPIHIDTRSLYANALEWLGGPTHEVLGGDYDRYDLVRT